MKYTYDMQADVLFRAWQVFMIEHRNLALEMDMCFDKTKGEPNSVLINLDEFMVHQTNNPDKMFFVECNDLHPGMTLYERESYFENLKARMTFTEEEDEDGEKVAVLDIEDSGIEPKHYIGKYVASIKEAVDWVKECHAKPVSEWEKEYNPPIQPI